MLTPRYRRRSAASSAGISPLSAGLRARSRATRSASSERVMIAFPMPNVARSIQVARSKRIAVNFSQFAQRGEPASHPGPRSARRAALLSGRSASPPDSPRRRRAHLVARACGPRSGARPRPRDVAAPRAPARAQARGRVELHSERDRRRRRSLLVGPRPGTPRELRGRPSAHHARPEDTRASRGAQTTRMSVAAPRANATTPEATAPQATASAELPSPVAFTGPIVSDNRLFGARGHEGRRGECCGVPRGRR